MAYQGPKKSEMIEALIASNGGWRSVLSKYPIFHDAISKVDGRSPKSQVACPFGMSRSASSTKFRLIHGEWELSGAAYHNDLGRMNGFNLVMEAERCNFSEAMNTIADMFGGLKEYTPGMKKQLEYNLEAQRKIDEEKLKKAEESLWKVNDGCIPASESPEVAAYLRSRGLKGDFSLLPESLWFNPKVWYKPDEDREPESLKGWYNCLVASVTKLDGTFGTFHRHYIKDGKKAPVFHQKKMMTPMVPVINGGAVKLDEPVYIEGNGLLGISEGLETALAVREGTGMPMWSGIDAYKMRDTDIPDDVNVLVIWGDHDRSETGSNVAEQLKERMNKLRPDCEVIIFIPDEVHIPEGKKSVDWLDIYERLGADAFPMKVNNPDYAVKTGVEENYLRG